MNVKLGPQQERRLRSLAKRTRTSASSSHGGRRSGRWKAHEKLLAKGIISHLVFPRLRGTKNPGGPDHRLPQGLERCLRGRRCTRPEVPQSAADGRPGSHESGRAKAGGDDDHRPHDRVGLQPLRHRRSPQPGRSVTVTICG